MCRIFYSPSDEIKYPKDSIWKFFKSLEKLGGRDGNGVYTFSNNELHRSHDHMPVEAKPNGKLIFHTRIKTKGIVADHNCQPFVGDRYILAHNGSFYDIETYAYLLGYPLRYQEKKYSDSYKIHFIIEKIGILNFYQIFKSKHYGVLLVYDRQKDEAFLLKTSGEFTTAVLKHCGLRVYASSGLGFWQLEEPPKDIGNGLYRLDEYDYHGLDIIKSTTTYGYGAWWHDKVYNKEKGIWEKKEDPPPIRTRKRKEKGKRKRVAYCQYCETVFPDGIRYYDDNYVICETCYYKYVRDREDDDKEIIGIRRLFGGIPALCEGCKHIDHEKVICTYGSAEFTCAINDETGRGYCYNGEDGCYNCNWLHKDECWFGGIKQKHKGDMLDFCDSVSCNTNSEKPMDILATCYICLKELKPHDDWGIYEESILCYDCMEEEEKYSEIDDKEIIYCMQCGYLFEPEESVMRDEYDNAICFDCSVYGTGYRDPRG